MKLSAPLTPEEIRTSIQRQLLDMDHDLVGKNKVVAAVGVGKNKIQFWVGRWGQEEIKYTLTVTQCLDTDSKV